jgi:hypothetical protein
MSEYLAETYYMHECGKLNPTPTGLPEHVNLYSFASFLLTAGYCAHKETNDNGESPRAKIAGILSDWLTPERERNLFLRHRATLDGAAEEIAERLLNP